MSKNNIETSQISLIETKLLHEKFWSWHHAVKEVPWALRTPNMPEILSEAIVCLCTNSKLITKGHGDILLSNGEIGEVKATSSAVRDVSSFSPTSDFDKLFFVHMDKNSTDIYHVYNLNMNRTAIEKIKVNQKETFESQAKKGRRPRFSIIDSIIMKNSLKPNWLVNMKIQKIQVTTS